jgi:hypothetical protein
LQIHDADGEIEGRPRKSEQPHLLSMISICIFFIKHSAFLISSKINCRNYDEIKEKFSVSAIVQSDA